MANEDYYDRLLKAQEEEARRNGAYRGVRNRAQEDKYVSQVKRRQEEEARQNGAYRGVRNRAQEDKYVAQVKRKQEKERQAAEAKIQRERTYGATGNPHLRLVVPAQTLFSPSEETISSTDKAVNESTGEIVTLNQCIRINEIHRTKNVMRAPTASELEQQRRREYENSSVYKAKQAYSERWDIKVAQGVNDAVVMGGMPEAVGVKAAFGIATSANIIGQLSNGAEWDLRKVDITDAIIAGGAGAVGAKYKTKLMGTVLVQEVGYATQQGVNFIQGQKGAGVSWEGATAVGITTAATYGQGKLVTKAVAEKTRTISVVSGKGQRGKYGQYIPPTSAPMTVVDKKGISQIAADNLGSSVGSTTQEIFNPGLEEMIKDRSK